MSRPTPPDLPSSAVDQVGRRQQIVDLVRVARRAGSTSTSHSHHDQDEWVSGRITLDELVARSQSAPGAETAAANNVEVQAGVAATETRTAVALAATTALRAAGTARATQSAAASKIALATAETVRQAALLLQLRVDEDAERVTHAADDAALLVALAVLPGTEEVNAERAVLLAASIQAAAIAKAEETALAAATVARAAATAAADAAACAADAAMALELQVADTAAAVQAVAAATARSVEVDTIKAAEVVRAGGR